MRDGSQSSKFLKFLKFFFFFFREKFLLIPFQLVIPTLMAYETRHFYSDISIQGSVEALD